MRGQGPPHPTITSAISADPPPTVIRKFGDVPDDLSAL
jgi:hypothetical protein